VPSELPPALRTGIDAETGRVPEQGMARSVERLIEAYRSGKPAAAPILTTETDVAAYAAYRMPATFSAVRGALAQLVAAAPGLAPETQLDVGGGSGAAAWAAMDAFPSLRAATVLDQVGPALDLGRRLAVRGGLPLTWSQWHASGSGELPAADLVTISYVLGELSGEAQAELIRQALRSARLLVVVEPGTPAGYERILRARTTLIENGLKLLAPCPHQHACPLAGDWCHFSARVNRTSLHRRLKNAQLGHEDEKYSFVAAVTDPAAEPSQGRVLRHPLFRKGMVTMELCQADGTSGQRIVSKKTGPLYRAARDIEWGDPWPPAENAG
jgi:ribosomal protein RSM22 (predicted rRNA methylase)